MADIKINNLSGLNLLNDSESFLTEISDEANEILGGAELRTFTTLKSTRITVIFTKK